jgi:hypothetical protein
MKDPNKRYPEPHRILMPSFQDYAKENGFSSQGFIFGMDADTVVATNPETKRTFRYLLFRWVEVKNE